ncbi:MAG: zinc ribbon domain-containing protein [Phycisphaerae bacterium]|nr:zinc ribbon domain-containing protein [Phycisphaerae bacterium]
MPMYEYATDDGTRIELLRSMADADKPVEDPEGRGRVFKRVMSTFAAQGAGGAGGAGAGGGASLGTCCPCGKGAGMCSRA